MANGPLTQAAFAMSEAAERVNDDVIPRISVATQAARSVLARIEAVYGGLDVPQPIYAAYLNLAEQLTAAHRAADNLLGQIADDAARIRGSRGSS